MNQELINVVSGDDGSDAAGAWDQICDSLVKYRHIFLFVDFDGTLSELTTVPSAASLDSRAREILKRLNLEKQVTAAVLSGRSVADLSDRVGLPLIYGGDHGLEIRGSDFEYLVQSADFARLRIPAVCNDIRQSIGRIPGALVEAKRFTASVHYRQVTQEDVAAIEAAVIRCVDPEQFEIRKGKCVFEIRPRVRWNKGNAVEWILARYGASPEQAICIGDDEGDEEMFRRVPQAVNVRILDRNSKETTVAPYFLERSQVTDFLSGILDVVHGVSGNLSNCATASY